MVKLRTIAYSNLKKKLLNEQSKEKQQLEIKITTKYNKLLIDRDRELEIV